MSGKKIYYFLETTNMIDIILFTAIINAMVLVIIWFILKFFLKQKDILFNYFLFAYILIGYLKPLLNLEAKLKKIQDLSVILHNI